MTTSVPGPRTAPSAHDEAPCAPGRRESGRPRRDPRSGGRTGPQRPLSAQRPPVRVPMRASWMEQPFASASPDRPRALTGVWFPVAPRPSARERPSVGRPHDANRIGTRCQRAGWRAAVARDWNSLRPAVPPAPRSPGRTHSQVWGRGPEAPPRPDSCAPEASRMSALRCVRGGAEPGGVSAGSPERLPRARGPQPPPCTSLGVNTDAPPPGMRSWGPGGSAGSARPRAAQTAPRGSDGRAFTSLLMVFVSLALQALFIFVQPVSVFPFGALGFYNVLGKIFPAARRCQQSLIISCSIFLRLQLCFV